MFVNTLLKRFYLEGINPKLTPAEPNTHLLHADQPVVPDKDIVRQYQQMVGSLMYLVCFTRPDIAYAVNQCAKFMSNPGPTHVQAAKRILAYLAGTRDHKLTYTRTREPGVGNLLMVYADSDHAGDQDSRGVRLNEMADELAGAAVDAEDDEAETVFTPTPPDSSMTFSWLPEGAYDPVTTADTRQLFKRWDECQRQQTRERVAQQGTYAGQLLTHADWGQDLLHRSRSIRAWTETEERRWMQMAGRTFPVHSYLRRIDKHPTGDCPWCGAGVPETLTHFQSECPQFQLNRTAAHHAIARATVAALKDLRLPQWQFFYETPLSELPFRFKWASPGEEEEQAARRPDGVAWNEATGTVIFLEFTRAMDNPDNMARACQVKGQQYEVPERALREAQRFRAYRHQGSAAIRSVSTCPLIFGVRGTVLVEEAWTGLQALELTKGQLRKILTCGVRAAVSAASDMCTARFAAMKCLPRRPRGPDGKVIKQHIPPKPFRPAGWRSDRGC
mmetsp:Transcript_61234/g.126488  ORF Transcript_61234/g.126488 Transcript_61234/m.126488 type:complete len:503 (-) Transcript_61234:1075-2583(-)